MRAGLFPFAALLVLCSLSVRAENTVVESRLKFSGDDFRATWWCGICEKVVADVVLIVDEKNITETLFHREMDDLCSKYFTVDEWLIVFCQYEIDQNALELYDVIVLRDTPESACEYIEACTPAQKQHTADSAVKSIAVGNGDSNGDIIMITEKGNADTDYSFVVISDMHIGQQHDPTYNNWLTQQTVEKINSLVEVHNIKLVFVTGDITDSAMPDQWVAARKWLDKLSVPYFPTLGNHDVWSYNNSAESSYEEKVPTGDFKFSKTFGDRFSSPNLANCTIVYNEQPCHNMDENITSWFQNWEMKWNNFVFYGLDWNTREHAIPGYKGALPTANIHDYPCGTLPWLKHRLSLVPSESTVVFLQHHPFEMPDVIPEFIYSFSAAHKEKVFEVIDTMEAGKYWGVIAGHLHTWYNGESGYKSSRQWLSEAVKLGSSISLVQVSNGEVQNISKLFGYDY